VVGYICRFLRGVNTVKPTGFFEYVLECLNPHTRVSAVCCRLFNVDLFNDFVMVFICSCEFIMCPVTVITIFVLFLYRTCLFAVIIGDV